MTDIIRISVVVPVYSVKEFVPHAIQVREGIDLQDIVDNEITESISNNICNEVGDGGE